MGCVPSRDEASHEVRPDHGAPPDGSSDDGKDRPRMNRADTTHYTRVHEAAMAEIFRSGNGVVGLRNLGNTCFMNACLQSLCHAVGLADYFLGYEWHAEINASNPIGFGGELAKAFGELMEAMWSQSARTSIVPVEFKAAMSRCAPMFAGHEQHDAHELLTFLLDALHEDLNRCESKPYVEAVECDGTDQDECAAEAWAGYLKRDRSIIVDLFQGQLRSSVGCARCGHKCVKFDPFQYLSVPVVKSGVDIEQCIEDFSAEERLDGDNAWSCAACRQRVRASKRLELWKLPPLLVIHLKRFDFDTRGRAAKVETYVDFPLVDLDLSAYCQSPQRDIPLYDCFAVINHHGHAGGGHYTAFARNRVDNAWYHYNDANVTRVQDIDEVKTSDAYVLLYSRVVFDQTSSSGRSFSRLRPQRSQSGDSPGIIVRRQSISLPHLWPHFRGEPDRDHANISLKSLVNNKETTINKPKKRKVKTYRSLSNGKLRYDRTPSTEKKKKKMKKRAL
ncbi:hypothetical protein CTAYLR_003279 [Chrysophaeum taylorii]|uniref:ubiquitinyl hydrolase 1 n=1 Tax=Chrysophaeum taylorii TaxID=2483200 RepID=A0AAD7UAD7_9STRA|nr:hypothetical protein CTAYLR_003279 [Chrysophaeum taylorii]